MKEVETVERITDPLILDQTGLLIEPSSQRYTLKGVLTLSISQIQLPIETLIADDILDKFRSKYGEADVKKYYPKPDVAVEVPL
jgi:hypothetical protein